MDTPNYQMFTIKITYFKANGKFYSTERLSGEFRALNRSGPLSCYMDDVLDYFKRIRESKFGFCLPGLSSNKWEGYIYIDCEQGYPCLILPSPGSEVRDE